MKHYVCRFMFCLVCILLLSVCAYAEVVDFSTMSIEELVSMRNRIDNEIYSRVISDNIQIGPETPLIYEGTYFVGKDIKPGSYTISYLCPEGSMLIGVFSSYEDYEQFKKFLPVEG
ncbi:MAG: hypothetical protein E7320_03805 [Clostridiales bacterium]|nr:hypothetical protein [Clostridiales bacterium]